MIFFDASAIVKAYVNEAGSPMVQAALAHNAGGRYLTPAVVLEVLSTLAKRRRGNTLSRGEYRFARDKFTQALGDSFRLLELHKAEYVAACELAHRHRRISAGPSDVLHVASALRLQAAIQDRSVIVASSDRGFLSVARAEGLQTFNPETANLQVLLDLSRRKAAN
jgi:predicted nucleic acid-binding protein